MAVCARGSALVFMRYLAGFSQPFGKIENKYMGRAVFQVGRR